MQRAMYGANNGKIEVSDVRLHAEVAKQNTGSRTLG
jgi:hypothetical protein